MLRTVADDTPSPAAVTRTEEATGSPDAMNSRTSAASTRFDRMLASCIGLLHLDRTSSRRLRVLRNYTGSRGSKASPCGELSRRSPRLGHDLVAVDAHWRELVHEKLAVDDGGAHIRSASGVDERRVRVGARCEVRSIAVHEDEVRALADFDRADVGFETHRAGAGARRHFHGVARSQRARLTTDGLKGRGEPHLLEHVEPVVARGS